MVYLLPILIKNKKKCAYSGRFENSICWWSLVAFMMRHYICLDHGMNAFYDNAMDDDFHGKHHAGQRKTWKLFFFPTHHL
jgi:hypothetical protein